MIQYPKVFNHVGLLKNWLFKQMNRHFFWSSDDPTFQCIKGADSHNRNRIFTRYPKRTAAITSSEAIAESQLTTERKRLRPVSINDHR